MASSPSFFSRLALFLTLPWRVLFNGTLAGRVVKALPEGQSAGENLQAALDAAQKEMREVEEKLAAQEKEIERLERSVKQNHEGAAALQLLNIFQREGRLIDFLKQDISGFSDEEIGTACRVLHEGSKKALDEYFTIDPLRGEEDGASVQIDVGFDPSTVRLTGNVAGEPPYKGTLAHHGWKVSRINLPAMSSDVDRSVIAPAEVEL